MDDRSLLITGAVAGGLALMAGAAAAELEQAGQAEGLDSPESAVFASSEGVLYVSNVNGELTAVDGNGYISRLSLEGETLDREWVSGLNGPKGLALHEGKL